MLAIIILLYFNDDLDGVGPRENLCMQLSALHKTNGPGESYGSGDNQPVICANFNTRIYTREKSESNDNDRQAQKSRSDGIHLRAIVGIGIQAWKFWGRERHLRLPITRSVRLGELIMEGGMHSIYAELWVNSIEESHLSLSSSPSLQDSSSSDSTAIPETAVPENGAA